MSAAPSRMNPFPGLRSFTQEEDYLFFGREEQTLELLQRLSSTRFVAVVGTSGSGKSSLVRCGLLSELLGGKMLEAGASWEIAVTHPGGNPLALLTDALLDADLYDRQQEHARENLLATLSRSHFGLVEAVKQADLGEGTNFLLVVDQFEEIFRFHEAGQTQQEAANEFVSLLLEAAAQKEVPIYVVLTMRSDFIGECGQFEGLAEMVNRGEFLIPRMTREQYKRIIEGPIKVAGGQIAPRLLQRLLNDLGQQADQLPCLQHALMRTWDVWAASGDTEALDLDDYQCVGKMSQALSLHADEIYESLATDRQRELCRGIFQALTVEESNNRGIRRPQRLGRLCQILEVSADELRPIINAYRQSGVTFLMPSPEVELAEQTIIDVSHESLMRVWARLRQWVEEETQAAGIYHRLSESAALHQLGKAGLYRDPELGIALAWREAKQPNAAWAERYRPGFATAIAFLEASQRASVAEVQSHEAARQHELEQAQQLAEAERQRAETKTRSARRLRVMLAGTALVALFAVGASIVAVNFWRDADRAKQTALLSEQSAKTEAERATVQELAAKEARRDAEQNLTRARAAIDSFMVNVSESQLLSTPGLQPLRAELLGSASKFYEDFLARNPDNPALQAGLADAFYRVGFVNNELGNHAQALVALEKSIALWDTAQKVNRDDAALRHGLAAAWYESARARLDRKDDDSNTYDAARNAARLWNDLATEHPADIVYKKSLARAFNLMGLASSQFRQHERAFLVYQQSLQIRLSLLPDHPDDVELLHGLAESFNNIGIMLADREHKLAMLQRSVEFNVVVHRLRPQNVEYALDLGIGHSATATQLFGMNRKQEAMASYRNGVEHMLQFIRANPAVPAMREMLSSILSRVRSLTLEPKQADDYARIFQSVRDAYAAIPRKTAADHFAFAQAQSDYAAQLFRARKTIQKRELTPEESSEMARLRTAAIDSLRQAAAAGFKDAKRLKEDPLLADVRAQGAFAGIVASVEAASSAPGHAIDPTVAARPPSEVERLRLEQDRATGYLAFGMVETALNRNAKAKESLEQALAIRRSLATADPKNEQRQTDLRIAQDALGNLYWEDGQLAKARDIFQQRIAYLEQAIEQKPQDPNLAARLADAHRELAELFADKALWEEAAPHYAATLKSPTNRSDSPIYTEILAPSIQLLEGNDNAYRNGCAQILKKYGADASVERTSRVARLYALRPVPAADIASIVALAEKAKFSWHAYTYALVLYRAGRFEDAIRTIEEARKAKSYERPLVDNFVLAMAHFQLGRHDRARESLKAVNGLTPRSMPPWMHFASTMLAVDWIVLRREANELIHGSPYTADDRLRRSRAFSQFGEFEKAEAECAAAIKALPDDPRGHVALARVMAQMERQEQAAEHLEKAQQLLERQGVATDVEFWRTYAEALSLLKRHDEASQCIRHAIAAQALVVLRPLATNADRSLLFDLHESLADALHAAGRPEKAREARTECALFVKVMGLPPLIRDAKDLLAAEGPGTSDVHELISGIDQLLAANQRSLPDNDANIDQLLAKLQQRRAELRRENLARKSVELAVGHAQKGQINEAMASFAEAMDLVTDGLEEPPLNVEEKARHRGKTLDWLRNELMAWAKQVESAPPEDRLTIGQTLRRLQQGSSLAGVHDVEGLAKFPVEEQRAFTKLWVHAAQLLTKAEGGIRGVPATEQVEEIRAELKKRNPGFDGLMTHKVDGGVVTELHFRFEKMTDFWPVRSLVGLRFLSCAGGPLTDLSPLQGLPLTRLNLEGTNVQNLEPLKGMPLTWLNLHDCKQVRELGPLKGMPLTYLHLWSCPVDDLGPLKGMPLSHLGLGQAKVLDLEPLRDMPLTSLDMPNCTKVQDLGPLKGMKLASLNLSGCSEVRDLSPLEGMQFTNLSLWGTQVEDLSPLNSMPLTSLDLHSCPHVQDLAPFKGMPLTWLNLAGCGQVRELAPLKGMKLTYLNLDSTEVRDLKPLEGMPLTGLLIHNCRQVKDLETLKGMPLKVLSINESGVSDLKPLQGMELEEITLTPKDITQGLGILREMKSLRTIGAGGNNQALPAAEFWARYDKGEFK